MKLGVVIPVYNENSNVLSRCFNSIKSKKWDLSCVVVDDFSDVAVESCFPVIRHSTNLGQGFSRNTGIKNLPDVDYIMFVDSDDYLDEGALDELYDVVVSNPNYSIYQFDNDWNEHGPLDLKSDIKNISCYNNTAWGKIYKKDIFSNLLFPKGIDEDVPIKILTYLLADSIYFYPKVLYRYNRRYPSLERRPWNVELAKEALNQFYFAFDYIKRNNLKIPGDVFKFMNDFVMRISGKVDSGKNEVITYGFNVLAECYESLRNV